MEGGEGLRAGSPSVAEALGRGGYVSVYTRGGNDISGYVCDRDGVGLLVDVRDPSGDPADYEFLPWTSVERVVVRPSR